MTDLVPIRPPALDPLKVYLASLPSDRSKETCVESMHRLCMTLGTNQSPFDIPWSEVRYEHTNAFRAALLKKHSPATVLLTLAMLRGVLRTARNLGQMTAEEYIKATSWGKIRGERLPAGRALEPNEVMALFGAANTGAPPFPAFAAALLAVMCGAGLRRNEVALLEVSDVRESSIVVHGKGNRERAAPLPTWATGHLQIWRSWRILGSSSNRPLFPVVYIDGRVRGSGITPIGVWHVCRLLARRAGIKHFSPHDLRRTFVSRLLESGVDLATVQRLAGHASPQTTVRYDRRSAKAAAEAVERLRYDT